MIYLTHLDDSNFVLDASRIEMIQARPDTVITLVDGKHLVVRQSVDEVVSRVVRYQQLIHRGYCGFSGDPNEGLINHG